MSLSSISTINLPPYYKGHRPTAIQRSYCLYGLLLTVGISITQPLFSQIKEYPLTLPANSSYFRGGIDMDGNKAVVAAEKGVFVFELQGNTWKRTASLKRSDPFIFDLMFVGISGNRIALLDYNTIYVYEYKGSRWVETAKLAVPGGSYYEDFYVDSHPIDIDGSRIVTNGISNNKSVLCVYDYNGSVWKLTQVESLPGEGFGPYLALSGNRIVSDGLVYEFNGTNWVHTATLTYKEGVRTADIDNNRIVLNGYGGYCKVYEKKGSTWKLTATLTPKEGVAGLSDNYGSFVSLSGNLIAVKVPLNIGSYYSGLICVFEYNGSKWVERANVMGDPYNNIRIALSGKNLLIGGPLKVINLDNFSNPEEAKIIAPDGQANAEFGAAIYTSYYNLMIIGAPHDSEKGTDAGAAYIYERKGTTWQLVTKLMAADAAPGDQFGAAVYITYGYAIIGAPFNDDKGQDAGAAYWFQFDYGRNRWVQYKKLIASDGAAGDQFGTAVSNLAVGAPYHDSNGMANSGAVYIYDYYNGENKITAPHPKKGDLFGSSLYSNYLYYADGPFPNTLIIGAPRDDEKGSDAGAAYVFISTTSIVKLTAPDGAANDRFGTAVAMQDNHFVVGAPLRDDDGNESGAAYVFEYVLDDYNSSHVTINKTTKLTASDAVANDRFGTAVAVDSKKIAIGSTYADHRGTNAGAAYVFAKEENAWFEKGKLTGKARTGDRLGSSVAFYERQVMVGAYHDDDPVKGKDAGSAYIFNIYNLSDLPVTSAPLARTNHEEDQTTKEQLEQVEGIKNPLSGIKEMKMYPNPFAEKLSIALDQDQAEAIEITLMDQLGRILYKKQFSADQSQDLLDVDLTKGKPIASGLVYLGLKTPQGNSQWIRLLKE